MSDFKFVKKDSILSLRELEAPYADKSFEEITGEEFEREVEYRIVDLGNGYATTEKIKEENESEDR